MNILSLPLDKLLFFKGLGNSTLADSIMVELREYFGQKSLFSHIEYAHWGDGEVADVFRDYEAIKDQTVVFFECLKDKEVMLRFLQLCWSAKHQYKAKNIIAVLPFMHHRRQDRLDYFHEIWRGKWLAEQLKFSGVSHVITVTPHSAQMGINLEQLGIVYRSVNLSELFASKLRPHLPEPGSDNNVKVFAPDEGSIQRAIDLARCLGVGVLFGLKNRGFNNETSIVDADQQKIQEIKTKFADFPDLEYATVELVDGAIIIMVEDEVDSGATANSQANKLRKHGAKEIYMVFTHAVCTDPWRRKLFQGKENPFNKVMVSDTIHRGEASRTGGRMHDVSVAGPVASEIFRLLREIE